ncbi:ribonuclease II [Solidesulfovibrio fructosivorans JJ]]|uniref:Ribonuclease II n=1 Tax=Solidesulfovibrio fructosivorans JJ] TaxID=596151 RepID=E1JZ44_SOLFR|nr:ribonuclease catalytic domain-containing protein [Solidesulfovibrio fructosivorans]EFL50327.1 ribonuclease II [Solidesulfovibrio fructosivorans JJ]]
MALERYAGPGCLVEFMQGNQPQVAWVLEESSGRLRLYTLTKREEKLAASRVLPWMGPRYDGTRDRSEMLEILAAHQVRREAAAKAIAPLELWELAQGEVREESAEWFAGLVGEEPDVDAVAAMGRALLSCKTHFKFHPPKFEVFPAELVERRMAEAKLAEEREKVVVAGQAFFKELWQGWLSGDRKKGANLAAKLDPEAAEKLKNLLRRLMADADDPESATLWAMLRKGLPDHPFQAYILATQWGIVPPHYNYLLDQADYAAGDDWWRPLAAEVEARKAGLAALCQEPESIPFVSVDSPTTRDIDDAFYAEPRPDGGMRLVLALADPALDWEFDGPLDKAVAYRASSLYLPEGVSHMLPEELGTGLYSLLAGEVRPSLVMEWEFSGEGDILGFAMRKTFVRLAENTTYAAVEAALDAGDAPRSYTLGHALAVMLRQKRLERGAVIIERPEPDVVLSGYPDNTTVEMGLCPSYPKSQLMVSEFMILGNTAAAEYAVSRGAAMLFRTQDAALSPEIRGVHGDPPSIQRVVRELPPTLTEPDPRPHATLAAPAYAPVTSPLRRYGDLVNLAQLESLLRTGAPRWSRGELEARLPELTSRLEAVGRVQRFRPRYWKLLFLQRHCRERTFEGIVVDLGGGGFVSLALPDMQMYVRATKDTLGDTIYIGQRYALRLGRIDPLTNELRVFGAEEIPARLPEGAEAFFMGAEG